MYTLEKERVLLNTAQAAKRWQVCPETMRRYLRSGELPSIIIKRHRLILLDDIIRYENAASVGRPIPEFDKTAKN